MPSTVLGARDKKLKAVLPELVLLLGDGCEKELPPHKNLHVDVYSGSFIIINTWKHIRRPSVGERINSLWFVQMMEYYSGPKRSLL